MTLNAKGIEMREDPRGRGRILSGLSLRTATVGP